MTPVVWVKYQDNFEIKHNLAYYNEQSTIAREYCFLFFWLSSVKYSTHVWWTRINSTALFVFLWLYSVNGSTRIWTGMSNTVLTMSYSFASSSTDPEKLLHLYTVRDIEVETKWPPIYRKHFQTHLLLRMAVFWLRFHRNLFSRVQLTIIGSYNGLQHTGNKPMCEPVMVCFTGAHMRHMTSMS